MGLFDSPRRCPDCDDVLSIDARACQCGWRERPLAVRKKGEPEIDLTCAWHSGCGLRGSISDGTNGMGPWYCSEHYWMLKGQPPRLAEQKVPYRDRWYAENKKQPEIVMPGDVGTYAPVLREPGQDDEEREAAA